jgi:hypothetical protein
MQWLLRCFDVLRVRWSACGRGTALVLVLYSERQCATVAALPRVA